VTDEQKELVLAETTERDGKKVLACAAAFRLAAQHDLLLREIGAVCEQNGVKIVGCQLGCFK